MNVNSFCRSIHNKLNSNYSIFLYLSQKHKYILYEDNTISNVNGDMLVGYDSNNIEIVGYIQFDDYKEKDCGGFANYYCVDPRCLLQEIKNLL